MQLRRVFVTSLHCVALFAASLVACSSHDGRGPQTLPPLKVDPFAGLDPLGVDEEQAFTFRKGPKPPPSITHKEKLKFPVAQAARIKAAAQARKQQAGPLKVLRTHPKGGANLVGAVSVTFNQPMVPVASLAELKKRDVPIKIEPMPAGRFRWLGTQTVAFEPEGRMPFGSDYKVTVPAGTRSALGGKLENKVSFRFTTPRPTLVRALPPRYGSQARPDTAIALELNQPVKISQLLELLQVNNLRGADFSVVPHKRWAKLRGIGHYIATWDPERTVVLQPRKPLKKGTHYNVTIKQGLRGEGPRATTTSLRHYFTTFGPFKAVDLRCGHYRHCAPRYGLRVYFSNPVITDEIDPFITISPKVPELELRVTGRNAYLKGKFEPQTRYTVKVACTAEGKCPVDIHDQKLAQPFEKTVKTGDLIPDLRFPVRGLASLERSGKRQIPLEVVNVGKSRLRMVKVDPADIFKVIQKARYSYDNGGRRDPLQGIKRIVVKRTLLTGVKNNKRGKIGLSTDEALGPRGSGPVYVELRSEELKKQSRYANPFRGIVVQVTDIGIMARYDVDRIVAHVSDMQSGRDLSGARALLRNHAGKEIWRGKVAADGMLRAPGRRALKGERAPFVLWIERGSDKAFVILDQTGDDGGYIYSYSRHGKVPREKVLRMHLFTDRSPYRPGETVHLKGVLRTVDLRPTGGVQPLPAEIKEIRYTVTGPRGHKLVEDGEAKLSGSGAFAVDVKVPAGSDLGNYRVQVTPVGSVDKAHGSFKVEEYRPPEFSVKVDVQGEPYFVGRKLSAKVGADYLFGAPMAGARCSWTLTRAQSRFTPPNNPGFVFGEPVPWRLGWRVSRGRRRHRGGVRMGYSMRQNTGQGEIVESGSGPLDAKGRLKVAGVKLAQDPESKRVGALSYTLEAQVFDDNRQSIAGRQAFTVHPADRYVGMRAPKTVIKAGGTMKVEVVLAGLSGKRIDGVPLTVEALQVKTKVRTVFEAGRWTYKYESKDTQAGACKLSSSQDVRSCEVKLPSPGAYKLRVRTKDGKGRLASTSLRVYASGPGYVPWNLKNQSRIELVPDKESYRPGETAKILVKSPLKRAVGLRAAGRGGMERVERFAMEGNAQVIEVPIRDYHLPELHVSVALARGRLSSKELGKAAKDLGRPTFAHGTLRLPVELSQKEVKVEVKPAKEAVGPSEKLKIKLRATDGAGKPVKAELAVMVVDEGVLSLLGYQTPDPLAFFWSSRGAGAPLADLRNVLLGRQKLKPAKQPRRRGHNKAKQKKLLNDAFSRVAGARPSGSIGLGALGNRGRGGGGSGAGYGRGAGPLRARRASGRADTPSAEPARQPVSATLAEAPADRDKEKSGGDGRNAPRIRSRSHFATTAYYNPSVLTDAAGNAEVTVKMPDNMTTFRIMAVALSRGRADRFGKGEAQVKVRKVMLMRPSLPRFLTVGDRFEAAVMVHNQTDKKGTVDVLVRGRNATPGEINRRRVEIAAHGAKEVRFPMTVKHAGPARIQFAAVLGDKHTDAVEKQVPVLLPVTTEAFATYGATDTSVSQPVVPPRNALAGYGGLEISMSSTALNGLEDSVRYLVSYPHECTEQTASRVLPIFSLSKILSDFNIAELKDVKARGRLANAGVRKLIAHQRYDGGWGNWKGSRISWPYISAYATYTLLRAKESGEKVTPYNLKRAQRFLKQRLDHPLARFGEQYNWVAQAASVWVLSELKQHETAHLSRLYGLRKRLPLFARAWLMTALFRAEGRSARVNELLREIDNAAIQTPSAARFSEGKTESLRLLMHSNDRTDAIVLQALLEVAPKHQLLVKVARGLLQARVHGRWSTTQSNAFALVALARYYKQVEKVEPDHVSQIWYGEGYMGEGKFSGRQMKVVQQKIPLAALRKLGDQELQLAKRGKGKLYYRIGLRYAPTDLTLPPEEQGFSVSRLYEAIRDAKGKLEKTVKRRGDGSWEVKAGATVRVRIVLVVPSQRYFVAIADPLPAGLEAINLKMKTSARNRLSGQLDNKVYDSWSWYSLLAFDHREMRDDRVVLFADRLPAGVYEYTYLARATTYGSFIVAPTKAEEMYHPETFGRAGTTRLVVK
jgi:alpha-2-macroglobulin